MKEMGLEYQFEQDCIARGLTRHTAQTYRSWVGHFLKRHPDPTKVTLSDLRTLLEGLKREKLAGGSLKGYFYAVGAFYNFLVFSGLHDKNPIPLFRQRYLSRVKSYPEIENSRQLISIQQMKMLIEATRNIQEFAILMTLAKTGMRRGELLDLKMGDIDLEKGEIRIPAKAKRSNRLAFIDEELRAALKQYLLWRKDHAMSSWLWITKNGRRIHKDHPGRVLAVLGRELGVHDPDGPAYRKLTPHCFRHWFTTHLFRAKMNVEHIKFLRGDRLRIEGWQWYIHIDPEIVRQEYLMKMPNLLTYEVKIQEANYDDKNEH